MCVNGVQMHSDPIRISCTTYQHNFRWMNEFAERKKCLARVMVRICSSWFKANFALCYRVPNLNEQKNGTNTDTVLHQWSSLSTACTATATSCRNVHSEQCTGMQMRLKNRVERFVSKSLVAFNIARAKKHPQPIPGCRCYDLRYPTPRPFRSSVCLYVSSV